MKVREERKKEKKPVLIYDNIGSGGKYWLYTSGPRATECFTFRPTHLIKEAKKQPSHLIKEAKKQSSTVLARYEQWLRTHSPKSIVFMRISAR